MHGNASLFADPSKRHLLVIAHQDDELGYGGLLHRLRETMHILWVTNGDGLAPEVGMDPAAYASMRKAEAIASAAAAGIPAERTRCLDYSEIEIYDHFIQVTLKQKPLHEIVVYFAGIGRGIKSEMRRIDPDVVWTVAFQNGHPEHDMVHYLAAHALREYRNETGKRIPLLQLPEYEFTILVPLRFKPWFRGEVLHIDLSEEEVAAKIRMRDAYPSQKGLFAKFERTINGLGRAARFAGRGFSFESFVRRETFSPVPEGFPYSRSTHLHERLNYMFEEHKGVKVRFDTQVRAIICGIEGAGF